MTDTETLSPPAPDSVAVDAATAIKAIAAGLKAQTVVPYLGPGAFDLLPEGTCPIPRNSAELVKALNAKVPAPGRIRNSLTAVAQYIETRKHRKTLEKLLNEMFRQEVPASAAHVFLANLPKPPPLIVDVWYDDALEKLLAEKAAGSWGQIQGISHPQSNGEWVKYYAPDGAPLDGAAAESWETTLYKPCGSVSPAGHYLISDSDFVEILTEIDIQTPIPPVVQNRRTGRNFLFIGCRFDAEIQRTFARQISKRSADAHWAIIAEEPSKNEAKFLEKYGIQRVAMPLQDALASLTAELAG